MSLQPTPANLYQHILRAHLQIMLWKVADINYPPLASEDITKFGWFFKDGNVMPVIADEPIAPAALLDIPSCHCKATNNLCGRSCSCKNSSLSCTEYCKCEGNESCQNPHTIRFADAAAPENVDSDEESINLEEDTHEEDE